MFLKGLFFTPLRKEQKNMKTSKKYWKIIIHCLFVCICLVSFLYTQGTDVQAASKKSQAVKAYKKFLSKSSIKWNDHKSIPAGKCQFALVYIDKDSVPELFVDGSSAGAQAYGHLDGAYKLYTFRNGKVKKVCDIVDMFSYYKKTGIFCTGTMLHGEYISYRKLSGASEHLKLRTERIYSITYYDAKDNKLTKAQFNSRLKKLVGKKQKSIPKCRLNTAKNRKSILK